MALLVPTVRFIYLLQKLLRTRHVMWSALQACFMIWHSQYIDFIIHQYEKKEICSYVS